MNQTSESIQQLMEYYFGNKNCIAVVLANEDGLPIASRIPEDKTRTKELEYLLSAMSSTFIFTGLNAGTRLSLGDPLMLTLELKEGIMLVRSMRDSVCCGVILAQNGNIAYYNIKIKEFTEKVSKILFPDE